METNKLNDQTHYVLEELKALQTEFTKVKPTEGGNLVVTDEKTGKTVISSKEPVKVDEVLFKSLFEKINHLRSKIIAA